MRVVIAPDSFKGSIGAADAAAAIAEGWRSVRPGDELVLLPQADGGEGTLDAIAEAIPEAAVRLTTPVTGPDGRSVEGRWLSLPDGTAVLELAETSGIGLVDRLDPLGTTTRGLGETIAAALDDGVTSLVIGLGGSASTDGGAGALAALGLGLFADDGSAIPDGGGGLRMLRRVERSGLRAAPDHGIRLLTDVTAPLLGPTGAAAVFGPQKGASPADIEHLEAGLANFAGLLGPGADLPGAGAAGGTGYGFAAAWGASLESGAAAIARLTGLDIELTTADVVVTGEGAFDSTSALGKVVGYVLETAPARSRVIVVAGQLHAGPVRDGGETLGLSLSELAGSAAAALADPAEWLREAGARAAGGQPARS